MSDREDLRSILFDPDSGDDAGPYDGERAAEDAAAVAEAEEDETNGLSPEELVAESVRQTNEALGIEEPEAAQTAAENPAGADDADDVAALKDKARQWDEYQAAQADQAVESERQVIIGEARQAQQKLATEKLRYKDFYKKEQVRLLDRVDADAAEAPNPDAYRRVHRENVIAACRQAEDLKLAELDEQYAIAYDDLNTRFEAIDQQARMAQQKPAYTDFLFEKLNLPTDDPEVRQQIMLAGQGVDGEAALHAMTKRAREIAWTVEYLRTKGQNLDQAAREVKAKEVKKSQPHPASATNTPRRAKPVEYAASGSERKKQLASILALR